MSRKVMPRRLVGRSTDAALSNGGRYFHALPAGSWRALCGLTPALTSFGWSAGYGDAVTCPKCMRKLNKGADR